MGVHYVAVNNDNKALFVMGKLLYFTRVDRETFEEQEVRPKTEEEMIAYVWSEIDPEHNYTEGLTYEDAVRMGKDLFAFGIQHVCTTDDLYDDDKYREYVYTHSLWENDVEIGRRADHFWGDEIEYETSSDGPQLIGQLGTMTGLTLHTCGRNFELDVTKVKAEPRKLNNEWQLSILPSIVILPNRRNPRTHLSKRRKKIHAKRITFSYSEMHGMPIAEYLRRWHEDYTDQLQKGETYVVEKDSRSVGDAN